VKLIISEIFNRIFASIFLFLPKNNPLTQRYFIELAYKGTNFHGWQVQPNARSVQQHLEHALSLLARETIQVTGAGRTDTGVHASYFVAHFDSSDSHVARPDFVHRLNRFLNHDITIFNLTRVNAEAHARFSAISRTYQYRMNLQKDPFVQDTSWYFFRQPDIRLMNEASRILFDFTDFTSFSKLHTDVKTNNCQIYQAGWRQCGANIVFTVKADRFLRNMVRALVGTLLEVGLGKTSPAEFSKIIEKKDRGAAGLSVPAHGLFLTDIEYPEEIFKRTARTPVVGPVDNLMPKD
jgi:tRNA pseudouridine38-40 synthase